MTVNTEISLTKDNSVEMAKEPSTGLPSRKAWIFVAFPIILIMGLAVMLLPRLYVAPDAMADPAEVVAKRGVIPPALLFQAAPGLLEQPEIGSTPIIWPLGPSEEVFTPGVFPDLDEQPEFDFSDKSLILERDQGLGNLTIKAGAPKDQLSPTENKNTSSEYVIKMPTERHDIQVDTSKPSSSPFGVPLPPLKPELRILVVGSNSSDQLKGVEDTEAIKPLGEVIQENTNFIDPFSQRISAPGEGLDLLFEELDAEGVVTYESELWTPGTIISVPLEQTVAITEAAPSAQIAMPQDVGTAPSEEVEPAEMAALKPIDQEALDVDQKISSQVGQISVNHIPAEEVEELLSAATGDNPNEIDTDILSTLDASDIIEINVPDFSRKPVLDEVDREVGVKVALVMGAAGIHTAMTKRAIRSLPTEVTLAFAPIGRMSAELAMQAHESGHEVLVEVPMEPVNYPYNNPGRLTLLTNSTQEENAQRLQEALQVAPFAVGVSTYLGARFSTDPAAVSGLMPALKADGLMLFENQPSNRSRFAAATKAADVVYAHSSLVIDRVRNQGQIRKELEKLENQALKYGAAIGIGSVYTESIEAVHLWSAGLAARGIELVPLTVLMEQDHTDVDTVQSQ